MSRLSRSDAQGALRTFAAIAAASVDAEAFARAGVRELPRLVGAELTTLSVCDLATGQRRVIGNPDHKLSAGDITCFDRFFFAHPLVRFHAAHHDGGAHRISDSLPDRSFHRTPLYGEYYRRIGIEHVIAIPLYVDGRTLVSFVLNRAGRDFSERESAQLEALRAPLAALYRQTTRLADARAIAARYRRWIHDEGWTELALDGELALRGVTRRGQALLAAACPGCTIRAGSALPALLDGWLRGEIDRGVADPWTELPAGRGTVGVRALRNADTGDWLVYLREEIVDEAAAPAELPLTPREREVLHWVAAGKGDAQIAAILGASPRTVQKHLQHIYQKLGVENRTAAAMRVLRGSTRRRR